MDSQAKYVALVCGDGGGDVYLRLPVAFGKNGDDGEGWISRKNMGAYCSLSLSLSRLNRFSLKLKTFLNELLRLRTTPLDRFLPKTLGGVISDYRGRPLDFGLGRTLGKNFRVVAARREEPAQAIEAVQAVLAAVSFPRFPPIR